MTYLLTYLLYKKSKVCFYSKIRKILNKKKLKWAYNFKKLMKEVLLKAANID